MGWEETQRHTKLFTLSNFWAGWHPGKPHNEIPGVFGDLSQPIGAFDANGVAYYDSALRKMFGYDNVTTTALESGSTFDSLFYSTIHDEWLGTINGKVYKALDQGMPTDITGSVTLTAGNQVHWADWQYTTTKLAIGVDGVNAPIKWSGSGNAATLGGSPPSGRWVAVWQNAVWLARTSTRTSSVYFSALGAAESWNADDEYKFDAPITGMCPLGDQMVIFMDDHIGVMQGQNNRALVKVDRFVNGVGCSGGHTIVPAKLGNQDVLIFHGYDGFYAFNGSPQVQRLSFPIINKYTGQSSIETWNWNRLQYAWATYWPQFGWYVVGLSSASDSTNAVGLVLDLKHPFQTEDGVSVPHWPWTGGAAMNCWACTPKATASSNLMFGSTDGFIYKITPTGFNRDGVAYTSQFTSKHFDLEQRVIIQEVNVLSNTQDTATNLEVSINTDLASSTGVTGSAELQSGADQLDVDFVLDDSVLGGADFTFVNTSTGADGRFIQFRLENSDADENMVVYGLHCILTPLGIDTVLRPTALTV